MTRAINVPRIKYTGLRLDKDCRKKGRIWLCDLDKVYDTALHLTERDGVHIAQWTLFEVKVNGIPGSVKRCGRDGIYYVECDIPASALMLICSLWVDLLDEQQLTADCAC